MKQKLQEEIKRSKKLMKLNEDIQLVRLRDTSYPNVKYDNDETKNDEVNITLLDDIQKAAKFADMVVTITTAKSGHNELTTTGNVSRHSKQTAVDISILNGIGSGGATNSRNGNEDFRQLGNKLKNELVSLGYNWNTEIGNDKAVLWQTETGGNHYNHLHVSNKTDSSEEEGTTSGSEENELLEKILNSEFMGKKVKEWLESLGKNFFEILAKIASGLKGIK